MITAPGLTALEQFEREPEILHADWVQAGRQWSRDVAERFLFHDVVFSMREWAHSTVRLMRIDGMLRERFTGSTITPVPSLCIVCDRDRTINPQWEERAWRERTDAMLRRIDAGHCPHVSTPRQTAGAIMFAADPQNMQRINSTERDFILRGQMTARPYRGV